MDGGEREVELAQDSLAAGARKLATFAPRKSYEGFVAKLLMRIKGHYNAHKLWPLSATIFMLSILPKLEGEDGNEALRHSSDRARHAAHVASFNFHLTRYKCTPRTCTCASYCRPVNTSSILRQWRNFFPT